MKTLVTYCTRILRLITLISSEHLDLVSIKKHSKFHYKRTIALCVMGAFTYDVSSRGGGGGGGFKMLTVADKGGEGV